MTVFRYTAIPHAGGPARKGRMQATTAAELRSSLLRVGLQVTDMRAVRSSVPTIVWRSGLDEYLRGRRQPLKAEAFDALSTMLDAGLPISEALSSIGAPSGPLYNLSASLRAEVSSGSSFAEACAKERSWFDEVEVEMLSAGESAGTLAAVLQRLADRQERSTALTSKLIAILTYPLIVLCVGVGVVIFLSSRTLPDLVSMLTDAGIEPPGLTRAIITLGQGLLSFGPVMLIALPLLAVATRFFIARSGGSRVWADKFADRITPRVVRRVRVAGLFGVLSELLAVGIPLVEALQTAARTLRGFGAAGLRESTSAAARRVSAGEAFSEVLDANKSIDSTTRRLLYIGETAGELPDVLASIASRERRRAERAIDALARIAEPAVVLALSGVIGLVVMGAVLPLIRLQEIIR